MLPDELLQSICVTIPTLDIRVSGAHVVVRNDLLGTSFEGDLSMIDVLEAFRTPTQIANALASTKISISDLTVALSKAFVMDVDQIVLSSMPSIGAASRFSDFLRRKRIPDVVLFGAPVDSAATGRAGMRHGPSEIRHHFPQYLRGARDPLEIAFGAEEDSESQVILDFETRRQYTGPVADIVDVGTIRDMPGESIGTFGARIKMLTQAILAKGAAPAMLGGDHSTTWFVLEALFDRHEHVGVIHFDAHHDMWPPFAPGFDYLTHGSPFFRALRSPKLKRLHQLGVRIVEPVSPKKLRRDARVSYVSARELQRMTAEEAFAGVSRDIPYYLTFDIDCLDPRVAPETGTPAVGGLTYYQATELVDFAAENFNLIGWDIVEVGQREQYANQAALCAAGIASRLLLGRMKFEPLSGYVRDP